VEFEGRVKLKKPKSRKQWPAISQVFRKQAILSVLLAVASKKLIKHPAAIHANWYATKLESQKIPLRGPFILIEGNGITKASVRHEKNHVNKEKRKKTIEICGNLYIMYIRPASNQGDQRQDSAVQMKKIDAALILQ